MSKTPYGKALDSLTPVLQKTASVINPPPRTFRDMMYTSRTLIQPSGATLPVAKGCVNAATDDQLQYLSTHPDFERLTE